MYANELNHIYPSSKPFSFPLSLVSCRFLGHGCANQRAMGGTGYEYYYYQGEPPNKSSMHSFSRASCFSLRLFRIDAVRHYKKFLPRVHSPGRAESVEKGRKPSTLKVANPLTKTVAKEMILFEDGR